jgi:hypothetical protein
MSQGNGVVETQTHPIEQMKDASDPIPTAERRAPIRNPKRVEKDEVQRAREDLYRQRDIPPLLQKVFNKLLPEETLDIVAFIETAYARGGVDARDAALREGEARVLARMGPAAAVLNQANALVDAMDSGSQDASADALTALCEAVRTYRG